MLTRRSLLSLPFAAVLAGCGAAPDSGPDATGTGAAGGRTLKIGLLTNGSLADSGWNSLAGRALERMSSELGAETGHQSAGSAQAEEALRGFARDGNDLIFAHGNEFGDAAIRVAEEFPDARFVVSSGEVEAANVASLRFDLGEASFLAGMVAAGLSKSGRGGQIGGENFPAVRQAFELFVEGGRQVNPSFSAPIHYLGNWHDANAARELALGMIRNGADVLFQNCDAAGEGVFDAARSHRDGEVLVIGSNANQNDLMPDLIPASAVLDVEKAFLAVAREVLSDSFRGGIYLEDMASENVYLAINPAFEDRIPTEVREQVARAEEEILAGRLILIDK